MSNFVDECGLNVKAGDGGAGCVAFRREAHVDRGGPDARVYIHDPVRIDVGQVSGAPPRGDVHVGAAQIAQPVRVAL